MQVVFDLETIPQQPEEEARKIIADTIEPPGSMSKPETIAEWMAGTGKYVGARDALIEEKYRKTALDGSKGQICSFAWSIGDSEQVDSFFVKPGNESAMLRLFFDAVRTEMKGRPPEFAGHNIGGFDLLFLYHRAVILQQDPIFDLGQHGRHGVHFFDTMQAWAGYRNYISLSALCTALGIVDDDEIDGSQVWDSYKAGNYTIIEQHNVADVVKVKQVLKRLQFN